MDTSSFTTLTLSQNAAILTIILAFAGYLVTFLSARMLARRRDKLRLVNKRLNEFYGPLYVASEAGNIAYRSLLNRQGKAKSEPILDAEMKDWVLWMTTIFMPLNDIREKVIIEKAHLIIEEQMPQCLLDFVTHVVGYKAVLAKWAEGDYTERRSTIGWPPEFDIYVKRSYAALKAEQTNLLHSAPWRLYQRFFRKTISNADAPARVRSSRGVFPCRIFPHLKIRKGWIQRRHVGHRLGQTGFLLSSPFMARRRIDMLDRIHQVCPRQEFARSAHALARKQNHVPLFWQRM